MKNLFNKSLYLLLPLISALVIHLIFVYGNGSFLINEWDSGSRITAAYFIFCSIPFSIFIAHEINNKN